LFNGDPEALLDRDDTKLLAITADQANLPDTNLLIDP
jgi:hypothetical protein